MPLVNVLINGHAYTVACDDGEEERLRDVSQHLDKRVKELVSSVGQVGDTRLLLLAGLVVCDELTDLSSRVDELQRELLALKERASEDVSERENSLADALEKTADRVEAIAARMAPS